MQLCGTSIPRRNAVCLPYTKERERGVSVTVAAAGSIGLADTIPKAASSHKFSVNA